MANINKDPYVQNDHMYMYDLGWLVSAILEVKDELTQAIDLRTIHYADPIKWNITTQYQANTVVIDENTGVAYISTKPVPSGVLLSDTNYWTVIFNYQDATNKLMDGIASNERDSLTASKDYAIGDLVWYGAKMYRVIKAMNEGAKFIVNGNITAITVADQLKDYIGANKRVTVDNYIITVNGNNTLTADYITEHSKADRLNQTDGTLTVKSNKYVEETTTAHTETSGSHVLNSGSMDEKISGNRSVKAINNTETYTGIATTKADGVAEVLTKDKTVNARAYIETLTGDKTVNAGAYTETLTGDKIVNAGAYTETLTGDKTVKAGAYTETLTGDKTVKAGAYTETLTGDKTVNAKNLTENVEMNREIDINGSDSVHIDGTSSINVGGLRTEVFANNKTDSVKGTHTIERTAVNANITGKTTLTVKDVMINCGAMSIETAASSLPIVFPDKTVDLYNIAKQSTSAPVYFLFGDSLYDGYTPDSDVRQGWFFWMKQLLTAGGATVLGTEDITDTNIGSAFSGQKTYVAHLQKTIQMHPDILDLPVSTVIVYSGTNDITHDLGDTYNGIVSFCQEIRKYWPAAQIKIGFLCSIPGNNNVGATYVTFKRAILEQGGTFINGAEYALGFKKDYSSDNVHLTPQGYKDLAYRLFPGSYSDTLHFNQHVNADFTIPTAPNLELNNLQLSFSASEHGVDVSITNVGTLGSIITGNTAAGKYPIVFTAPTYYPPNVVKDAYSAAASADMITLYLTNLSTSGPYSLKLYIANTGLGGVDIAGDVMRLKYYLV